MMKAKITDYLEIATFVEEHASTAADADALIDLIKWMTYENGKEVALPANYRIIRSNLMKVLHGR